MLFRSPARVPLFGSNGLTNQLGTKQYSIERLFRHKISHWLRAVSQLWPERPAYVSDDGHFLVVRSSRRSAAIKPVESAVKSQGFHIIPSSGLFRLNL